MSINELISEAVELSPAQRYLIIESLIKSLDVPNPTIDKSWQEESLKRLKSYENGTLKVHSYEDVFDA